MNSCVRAGWLLGDGELSSRADRAVVLDLREVRRQGQGQDMQDMQDEQMRILYGQRRRKEEERKRRTAAITSITYGVKPACCAPWRGTWGCLHRDYIRYATVN